MTDAIRCVHFVLVIDVVIDAEFRIEEIIVVIYNVTLISVDTVCNGRILQLVAYMTVLQVDEGIQTFDEFIADLTIDVEVCLA